jgi:hypothetical protein
MFPELTSGQIETVCRELTRLLKNSKDICESVA